MKIGKPKILCINDDRTALTARKHFLESHGYEVVATTDAQEALDIVRSDSLDLVVADHFLWYTTEAKAPAQIKRISPSLPIILFSGIVEPPENMSGVDAFVTRFDGPGGLLTVLSWFLSVAKAA
jgi:CheY-like chemotaxis protein